LIQVGKSEEVILGIFDIGSDLDGTMFPIELVFAEDADPNLRD
jgi:hypothetical protein